MESVREIRDIVAAINQAWVSGDYEAIGQYVAEHIVMAPPGLDGRVLGRAAYVASFRQFASSPRWPEPASSTRGCPGLMSSAIPPWPPVRSRSRTSWKARRTARRDRTSW